MPARSNWRTRPVVGQVFWHAHGRASNEGGAEDEADGAMGWGWAAAQDDMKKTRAEKTQQPGELAGLRGMEAAAVEPVSGARPFPSTLPLSFYMRLRVRY
jgi:hypothetical protein